MIREADWYFDFVSPYPYLQLGRFDALPGDLEVTPRPVLFAALLDHWGQKGPAEIPAKRRQTYWHTRWLAAERGLPFAGPATHPFNPLPYLRLVIAAGGSLAAVRRVYHHLWGLGRDPADPGVLTELGVALGILDPLAAIAAPEVKAQVRANTEAAIARGVFGVPTFAAGGELFWGDDATPLFRAFLDDPGLFRRPPYDRIESIAPSAERRAAAAGRGPSGAGPGA